MESADPADAAGFIAAVCRGLTGNYQHGLEQEKRILRTEAASRGGAGALGACLNERYGAAGPGLAAYSEYGLHGLGWAGVESWRRRWFVAGNAVLWICGAVPNGLRVELPPGPSLPPAPLRPLGVALPGFVTGGRGGVGLSLAARRSDAATVALDILQQRLTQVLRHERGLSYGVSASREWLDGDTFHAWLAADALPEQTASVAHGMLTEFETLAQDGGSPEEAADYVRRLRDGYESPEGPAAILYRQAQDILCGRPARNPAETLASTGQLGRPEVSRAAGELLSQMIVVTPQPEPAVRGRLPQLPVWSATAVSGTTRRSRSSATSLTVGAAGVTLTRGEGQHVTVRFGAVAAMLSWNDGQRMLIGADGFPLRLDPAEWPGGDDVVRSVESRVDPGLRIVIDAPGPERTHASQVPAGASAGSAQSPPPSSSPPPFSSAPPFSASSPFGMPSPPFSMPPPTASSPLSAGPRRLGSRILFGLCYLVVVVGILAILGGDVGDGIAIAVIGGLPLAWHLVVSLIRMSRPG
jgi:zinc protease